MTLTLNDYRLDTQDMFQGTKIDDYALTKMLGEYFHNETSELDTTCSTLTALDTDQGYGFFKGNFEERDRYQKLTNGLTPFILMMMEFF